MKLVGLTGGIGAGKSTVAAALARRGAVVIDGDRVAKELQEPGGPVFVKMVDRWGDRILTPEGTLDRPAMAAIAFGDPEELKALNAISHPTIIGEIQQRVRTYNSSDEVVILDIPLLLEMGREVYGVQAILVVDLPTELAVERLVTSRGMDEADAWKRIEAQASREDRVEIADVLLDNSGDEAAMEAEVDRAWAFIEELDPFVGESPVSLPTA